VIEPENVRNTIASSDKDPAAVLGIKDNASTRAVIGGEN
jgi:hypothetical protein